MHGHKVVCGNIGALFALGFYARFGVARYIETAMSEGPGGAPESPTAPPTPEGPYRFSAHPRVATAC